MRWFFTWSNTANENKRYINTRGKRLERGETGRGGRTNVQNFPSASSACPSHRGRGSPLRTAALVGAQRCSSNYCISANAHEILTTRAVGDANGLSVEEL